MHFVVGLPKTTNEHDAIWVMDRLTKSAHFFAHQNNLFAGTVGGFVCEGDYATTWCTVIDHII